MIIYKVRNLPRHLHCYFPFHTNLATLINRGLDRGRKNVRSKLWKTPFLYRTQEKTLLGIFLEFRFSMCVKQRFSQSRPRHLNPSMVSTF